MGVTAGRGRGQGSLLAGLRTGVTAGRAEEVGHCWQGRGRGSLLTGQRTQGSLLAGQKTGALVSMGGIVPPSLVSLVPHCWYQWEE
ncbi:unnamed protein product [Staurois parvus]|uniref:Uncharacterized protein n=1 Tax=Staurois parvus TaxID=386267 RepID=A0ABN9F8L2_9NEOB|nr:unnamed protein product [Staurois parvus]